MRVALTSAAEADLAAVLEWYDTQAPGISPRFLDEFEALFGRLATNPRQFPVVHHDTRRAGFRHFPYGLFFHLGHESVVIFACLHASRDPAHWQLRG